ncbi:MAG: TylF/MycF/NovP-related O-methyltransferase [Candidatus Latescibacterota bacterium]
MSIGERVIAFYVRRVKPVLPSFLIRWLRRIRLTWGYRPVLFMRGMPLGKRMNVVGRFIEVDFGVELAHRPAEIAQVCRTLGQRRAAPNEVMVEAGCWQGGSSAKFSIVCKEFGYRLYVYDSFQGVEATDQEGHDFTGEYAAELESVKANIERFGELDVCRFFPGWFADTIVEDPVTEPVRAVYIDCDLAKGTNEVLQGVLPALSGDGVIFSQDYHIPAVRKMLEDPETWRGFGKPEPKIEYLCHNLARIYWD